MRSVTLFPRCIRFLLSAVFLNGLTVVFPQLSLAAALDMRSVAEGGLSMAAHKSGGYAYVGYANVLVVKDVTSPALPVEVADRLFGSDVRCIQSSGNYLYVAASESGVSVFDIMNPANPVEVAVYDTPGSALSIALSGSHAFVADATGGLRVLDISNPAAPVEVGSETTSNNVTDVAVQGNYAYLSGEVALLILDVSTPSTPAVTGSYDLSGNSMAVAVDGDYAYHIHSIHFRAFDITDKSAPAVLDVGLVDGGNNIAIVGGNAFVPSQSGLRIFDISDPNVITHVGTAGGRHAFDVSLDGTLAYTAYGLDGFDVRDVTDVTNPLTLFDGDTGWDDAVEVSLAGDYAFVAATEGLLKVVDVTDPNGVTEIGNMEFTPFHLPLNVTAVAAMASYAYVAQAAVGPAGVDIEIVDVTDPANPVHAGTFNDPNNVIQINTMQVVGSYLYTAKGLFGLRIYDVTSPLAPATVANAYTNGEATDFEVDSGVTYLLDDPFGLRVIDTTALPAISEIGTYATPGAPTAVIVDAENDLLYIADDGNGLVILDVSTPSAPVHISTLTTIPGATDVAVSGIYAYVVEGSVVHVVDVSDPATPSVAGVFTKTSGGELQVLTRGHDVLLLEQRAGLYSLGNAIASGIADPVITPRAVLSQNTPNPFNPQTVIRYTMGRTGPVQLKVYDVSGRLVRSLVDEVQNSRATPYRVTWNGRDDTGDAVASGVYFYQLITAGFAETKKMVLLK